MTTELDALSAQFTDADYDELESRLRLNANVRGWTGDPLQQPAETVLAIAREIADRHHQN